MAYPNPYDDLSKRIVQRLRQTKIETRVLELIERNYLEVFKKENIVLAPSEKTRLYHQTVRTILTDMLAKLDRDQ